MCKRAAGDNKGVVVALLRRDRGVGGLSQLR
jgi:hypothetical protein